MQPQQTTQPQALFIGKYWYFPDGKKSVFGAKSANVQVYPGWLLVIDEQTGQEVRRFQLTSQNQMTTKLGALMFTTYAGQKVSWTDQTKTLYAYNPKFHVLFSPFLCIILWGKNLKPLSAAVQQATIG